MEENKVTDILKNIDTQTNIENQLKIQEPIKEKEAEQDNIDINLFGHFDETLNTFEEKAWKKGSGYSFNNMPIFSKKIEGMEEGLYILAGDSNTGKSGLLINILKEAAFQKNNNLIGIYLTLDDTKNIIISRLISSIKKIPISVSSKPKRYQDFIDSLSENTVLYNDYLKKRKEGLDVLKHNKNNFEIFDNMIASNPDEIYSLLEKAKIYSKTLNEKNNIIVGIDGLCDVDIPGVTDPNERENIVAKEIKDISTSLEIPILSTYHLKKANQSRRPVIEDLKGNNKIIYEASLVWLLYNDVGKNKQNAKIYYENNDEKCPIIEMDWAKNKVSSYKGRTYFYFAPEYSCTKECEEEVMNRFDGLIYDD